MTNYLKAIGACPEAIEWVKAYPDQSPQELWDRCHRGDWMMWLLGAVAAGEPWEASRRPLVKAAINCISMAQPSIEPELLLDFIVRLVAWSDGKPVSDELAMYAKRVSDVVVACANQQETGECRAEDIAMMSAYFSAYPVAYAIDIGAACSRVVGYVAAIIPHMKERILSDCADLVRQVYSSPPECRIEDVRRYRVMCPACGYITHVPVADPARNGWRVARNLAYYRHDVAVEGKHGLVNPDITLLT